MRTGRARGIGQWIVAAVLSCAVIAVAAHGEEVLPDGRLTIGGRFTDESQEFLLDAVVPVWQSDNRDTLLFVNPRASFEEKYEQEANLGVGVRRKAADRDVIFGLNAYWDRRFTEHDNEFDQLGIGAEVLSSWVDARFNYYFPEDDKEEIERIERSETMEEVWYEEGPEYEEDGFIKQDFAKHTVTTVTRRQFVRWEEAQEGFDTEIGFRIPVLTDHAETRIFAGYYDFETPFSDRRAKGWKGRLEVRTLPALIIDAEVYENRALSGVDFVAGVRVEMPFDLSALGRGENPFAGAFSQDPRAFTDRLTEPVIRDLHVRIEESGYVEEETSRSSTSTTSTKRSQSQEEIEEEEEACEDSQQECIECSQEFDFTDA